MYNPVRHVGRSNITGHVCLSCRIKISGVSDSKHRQYSSTEPAKSNDTPADDFAGSFNEIANEYSSSQSRVPWKWTKSKSREREPGERQSKDGETSIEFEQDRGPLYARTVKGRSGDGNAGASLSNTAATSVRDTSKGNAMAELPKQSIMRKMPSTKLRAKMLAMNSRPKWGDLSFEPLSNLKNIESFESLREADKVSVRRPLSPITKKPFGIDKLSDEQTSTTNPTSETSAEGNPIQANLSEIHTDSFRRCNSNKKRKHKEDAARGKRAELLVKRRNARAKAMEKKSTRDASKQMGKSDGNASQTLEIPDEKSRSSKQPKQTRAESSMRSVESFLSEGVSVMASSSAAREAGNKPTSSPKDKVSPPKSVSTVSARDLAIKPLDIEQPPVPGLSYGLDRVLFNSGVYQLQDPHSKVYNFDPYLQKIMPVMEFDFDSLKEYKTSSKDSTLAAIAHEHGKRYIGSTSSMTGTLSHFHYLLSNFRPLNCSMLSRSFPDKSDNFTNLTRAPNAIFLRWKNGTYAIDADKEFDSGNVLMMLGKSMEKLLTLPKDDFERYRKSDSRVITEEERTAEEAYQYTTMGDFLMRSQLDAYDPRLPGTGTFDLKTRAVVSVRMDTRDFEPMTGYEIQTLQGRFESYEREYYDMMRSTMLKYMLQVRMGRMDGIFVAYHNVERIFGFQYIPVSELDRALHGQADRCLGDQEFKLSLDLLQKVLDQATSKFPEKSLRIHFETRPDPVCALYVYAEPMDEDAIEQLQNSGKDKIAEFERKMMGMEGPVDGRAEVEPDVATAIGVVESSQDNTHSQLEDPKQSAFSGTDVHETAPSIENLASSSSQNDERFIASLESEDDAARPIYAATLICKSRINGSFVNTRPENMSPADEWALDYLLAEIENPRDAWAMYQASKARRKEAYVFATKETADEEGNVEKQENTYLKYLKELSAKGRKLRGRLDESQSDQEAVIFGQPSRREAQPFLSHMADVGKMDLDGLQGYMDWLYVKKSE